MATWSVRVELSPVDPPDDKVIATITDKLADSGAAVAVEDRDHLCVQFTVVAGTHRAAYDRGVKTVTEALGEAGVLPAEVVEVQVLTQAEFNHRLEQPRVPELWGPTEAAQFLGVSNPRLDQLVKEHPERLPILVKLAGKQGARIWLADTIRRFKPTWNRQVGRPKKAVPPQDEPTT